MISLYKKGNTNYEMNGDYKLDAIQASFRAELNGSWTLSLEVLQDDEENWKHIEHDAVVKIDLPRYKEQLFVIANPKRTDLDTVSATCYPVGLWDAQNELILRDVRPTNMTGKDALNYLLNGANASSKWKVDCNINRISTAYYVRKNFIQALSSDDDNSFLNRWGGEIIYDNYTFRVYEQVGKDQEFSLSVTKNISAFSVSEDDSDFVDVIIPVAYNGRTYSGEVRRDAIGRVPHKRFVEYDFIKFKDDAEESDYDDEKITVCQTMNELNDELVKAAKRSFSEGEFMPRFTYDIDYVDLRNHDYYQDGFENFEDLWLGDVVNVKNLDRNIATKLKVIGLTYDALNDEITDITLGSQARDFFNAASQAVSNIEKVIDSGDGKVTLIGEKIKGVIDMMTTSMRAQKSAAVKQDVRAILFEDLDQNSPLFGAMALGTQGLQISKKRTADGKDWIWGTAINYESVIADYIITGLLSSKNANFWLNLDTGAFELGDGLFKGTLQVTKGNITGKNNNFWLNLDTGQYELGEGLFKGTISTTENANIGKRLFLDYDSNGSSNASGIYLGNSNVMNTLPNVRLWRSGSTKQIDLRTGDSSNSFIEIVDSSSGGWIEFQSDMIMVRGANGKFGTGITYDGSVSALKTINGIVTGVTP